MLLSVVSSVAAMLPGASADVLPPQAIETEHRLRENPQAFDRADQFCTGRSVGDACQMPGTALAPEVAQASVATASTFLAPASTCAVSAPRR